MKKILFYSKILLVGIIITSLVGCSSSRTLKGGGIGAATGGAVGGLIGNKSGNTAQGAIIGAMVGGATGAVIGKYMDKQAEEIDNDFEGAKVERIGEGIKITFDSGILFGFDSYALSSAAEENIAELAETLKKYEDTEILIEGHTDSLGSDDYNQRLSIERADAVASYLVKNGVAQNRISVEGYGETQPIASNTTDAGRAANRRVEVAIYANKKLKKAAKRGDIDG